MKFAYRIIIFIVVSLLLVVVPCIDAVVVGDTFQPDERAAILEAAKEIACPPETARLECLELVSGGLWEKDRWSVRWQATDHSLIEVQLDPQSSEALLYLDETKNRARARDAQSALVGAWSTMLDIIEKSSQTGIPALPDSATFIGVEKTTQGWEFSWLHEVDNIVIGNDYFRVGIDHLGKTVHSYAMAWHSDDVVNMVHVSAEDAANFVAEISNEPVRGTPTLRVMEDSARVIVFWVVDTGPFHYWIDAEDGSILYVDGILAVNQDVWVSCYDYDYDNDTWYKYQEAYDLAKRIWWRFRSALYWVDELEPRRFEDSDQATILEELPGERLYYRVGHGDGYEEDGLWYTGLKLKPLPHIKPPEDQPRTRWLLPDDITMALHHKLAFICSCWSAADNFHPDWGMPECPPEEDWYDVEESIADRFLLKGADCVVGWDEPVEKIYANEFSEDFFDRAVNEYTFQISWEYAKLRCPDQKTRDIARIMGDTGLHLDEEDVGDSPNSARPLGYVEFEDDFFSCISEGLWGSDPDWYTFEVKNTYDVDIWVDPSGYLYGLDARLYVYTWMLQIPLAYANDGGVDESEHVSLHLEQGVYYILVTHYVLENRGGAYDLTVELQWYSG